MPFLMPGRTVCKICGKPIEKESEALGLGPIVVNELDPMRLFHDCVFHRRCVEDHPLGPAAIHWNQIMSRIRLAPCSACGGSIDRLEDLLPGGLLTSDPDSPLYRFNCLPFHMTCIEMWEDRGALCQGLREAVQEGRMRGPAVDWLLEHACSERP